MSEEPEDKILKAVGILQRLCQELALTQTDRRTFEEAIWMIQQGWLLHREELRREP